MGGWQKAHGRPHQSALGTSDARLKQAMSELNRTSGSTDRSCRRSSHRYRAALEPSEDIRRPAGNPVFSASGAHHNLLILVLRRWAWAFESLLKGIIQMQTRRRSG